MNNNNNNTTKNKKESVNKAVNALRGKHLMYYVIENNSVEFITPCLSKAKGYKSFYGGVITKAI